MIDLDGYNAYCDSLPATHKVVQWGGSHVWKVGEKVFAVGGDWKTDGFAITFKCSPESFDILKEQLGVRPAPYLASRGMKWLQVTTTETLSEEDIKAYIARSHDLAAQNLTKNRRRELGLEDK